MTFVWFSFTGDSDALLVSVNSASKFFRDGDRAVVYEEAERPITDSVKQQLTKVEFKQRPSWHNLNGVGKEAAEGVYRSLLAEGADGEVCKMDSDVILQSDNMRNEFSDCDLIGGQQWERTDLMFGMIYYVRTWVLEKVLANINSWTYQSGWPEDVTLGIEAKKTGARINLIPPMPRRLGFWSFHPADNLDVARSCDAVTFGTRVLIRGTDKQQRDFTAKVMAAYVVGKQIPSIPRLDG